MGRGVRGQDLPPVTEVAPRACSTRLPESGELLKLSTLGNTRKSPYALVAGGKNWNWSLLPSCVEKQCLP